MPPAVSWCVAPLAPSLRELLSEREAEGVYPVGCCKSMDSPAPCRGGSYASRRFLVQSTLGSLSEGAAERTRS